MRTALHLDPWRPSWLMWSILLTITIWTVGPDWLSGMTTLASLLQEVSR